MPDDLSRTFLGSGPAGYGVSTVMGAILTAWDPTTYANTVTDGAYKYQDCLVLHPSQLVAGRVLLYMTPGGPVILGNTYQRVVADPDPDVPGGGTTNPGGGTTDPGGGTGGGTDPDPGTLPWARTYPDGTAYPTIDGGGTDTPANLTTLSSAVSGGVYTYTGSTITSVLSVDFTGKTDITIRGITMGQGGMLRPKAGTKIILEVSAPYELSAGGEIVKWVGQYDRVRIDNSLFGPATEPGTPTATKNRYVQFGDSTSVGAKFGTVTRSTFRCKAGPGNPIHAAGDTANATGGVRYTLVTGNLFQKVRPFDENDHETNLMGISSLQLSDGQTVVEWNRYEDCRSEPEVISMKMNHSVIRGCTFHNCVGSASLRHGDDGEVNDCWFYGFEEETGSGSYNRTSAGPRLYGARHKIHHNTIQVNGNGGSRPSATSLYESPLTLDSGDVAPGSTSNGHANIVDVLVEKNLLVKCGNPIMVVDNYSTAPTGTVQDNWVVECAHTPSDGVGTKGSSPSKAGLTISGNTVHATVAAAGLTAGSGGHFVAPGAADRGARVTYLTAGMVGQGSTFDPWASSDATGQLLFTRPGTGPARTEVTNASDGSWVATFTDAARTVTLAGSQRTFTEQKASGADQFDRVITTGWGRSPNLGVWGDFNGSSSDFTVSGGQGRIASPTTNVGRYVRLNDVVADFDAQLTVTTTTTPAGAANSASLIGGWIDTSNHYRFRVTFNSTGSVAAAITKVVAGTETVLAGSTTVAASGYVGGQVWRIRAAQSGSALSMWAWKDGDPAPGSPTLTVTDSTFPSGKLGVRCLASTGATNNPTFLFDDFTVSSGSWPVSPSVTHSTWVRLLPAPFDGTVDTAWLSSALADTSSDLLAIAMEYITGGSNEASYGPLYAPGRTWDVAHADDGTRQEGSDWNDYLGVTGSYPGLATPATDSPESYQLGCLDCSGFVRAVFGYRGGLPMCLDDPADFNGLRIPRRSVNQSASGPGVSVVFSASSAPTDLSQVRIGDVLYWDADTTNPAEEEGQVDHSGIYLGVDSTGGLRFLSARKTADGPTMSDLGGTSVITGTSLYGRALRRVRRF